ncbi:hypothetical protein [Streptomyces sp. NBC_01408]|uniref:hypothetical protein n=1 Tax=Streptomyces sp. NBC_01408 TaxID=2903855 RepID=UPI00224DC28E|nr:hypothetical protein [Streptomyces sp. NBC_01408]MCX4695062.1 hypothetical protein [Streptomyces sp. NBC_01408]
MRRASRTGTRAAAGGKRWTVPGLAGLAGGAAVPGFGGLYAAGLEKVRDSVKCDA